MRPTLRQLADDLGSGRTSSERLVEECLQRIDDPSGEAARTYLEVDAEGARTAARAMDALRRARAEPSPFAGIPVSVKDLFDVRGQITRVGSRALQRGPVDRDATAVARWRSRSLATARSRRAEPSRPSAESGRPAPSASSSSIPS